MVLGRVSPQSCSGLFPVALEAEDLRSGCLSLKGSGGSRRQYWGGGWWPTWSRRRSGWGCRGPPRALRRAGPEHTPQDSCQHRFWKTGHGARFSETQGEGLCADGAGKPALTGSPVLDQQVQGCLFGFHRAATSISQTSPHLFRGPPPAPLLIPQKVPHPGSWGSTMLPPRLSCPAPRTLQSGCPVVHGGMVNGSQAPGKPLPSEDTGFLAPLRLQAPPCVLRLPPSATSPAAPPETPALPSQGCLEPPVSPRDTCDMLGCRRCHTGPGSWVPQMGQDLVSVPMRQPHALPRPKCRMSSGNWGSGDGRLVPGTPHLSRPDRTEGPRWCCRTGWPWQGPSSLVAGGLLSHSPDNPHWSPSGNPWRSRQGCRAGEQRSEAPRWSQHI